MFTVYFTKKILSGVLEGMTVDGTVRFATRVAAQQWIAEAAAKPGPRKGYTHKFEYLTFEIR